MGYAVTILSVVVGLFFVLAGTMKLTPLVNADAHKELSKGFIKFAKVFPLASVIGWRPTPQLYRQIVGVTEVICGLILAFVPGRLKQVVNLLLLVVMSGAIYTHVMISDPPAKYVAAIVFFVLLTIRLLVVSRQQGQAVKEGRKRD